MRIKHLYYLVEIAKTKSITLSAEHLYISQQGLSQAIQKLEADLNVSLYRRCRKGVELTPAGNLALEKAKDVITKYEALISSMEPYINADSTISKDKLTISATPYMSNYLPHILDLFRKKHPDITIHIEEQKPNEIVTKLTQGCTDIGLVNLPDYYDLKHLKNSNVLFEKIRSYEFVVCVAKSSPLAKKTIFKKSEIKNHPLVVYKHEPYLEILTHMFGDLSQLDIIVKTNSYEVYLRTITHSKALAIMTHIDLTLFREKSVVAIPLKDTMRMDFGWFTSTNHPLSSAGLDFLEIYKTYLIKLPF